MTQIQHGDKYQVVWNGSEWVITWTDDTALAADDVILIGVDPAETEDIEVIPVIMHHFTKNIGAG